MEVLIFNDPREAAAYWDRFEERSIKPIQPYLWEWPDGDRQNSDKAKITRVNREELDWMVLDPEEAELRLDAAVYTVGKKGDGWEAVMVLTHEQHENGESPWYPKVLLAFNDPISAQNLAQQIQGESVNVFKK